jgi:hypothetical protein
MIFTRETIRWDMVVNDKIWNVDSVKAGAEKPVKEI